MKVNGISLGWIVVQSLDEAIDFYTNSVGLKVMQHTPEHGWAELKGKEGMRLGLAQESYLRGSERELFKVGTNAVLCISVENIDKAILYYKTQGVKLLGEIIEIPGHVKMQNFEDKDGNKFQLVCEMRSVE